MKFVEASPKASTLIESMRDIGYTLETALADVVDNSITAGATNVHIHVDSTGADVKIGIVDDGKGMDRNDLIDAMRLGSRHPLESRATHDLGRFGLGLKTASFSQCRRLTVVSRKNAATSVAIWDLDHVAKKESWSLLVPDRADGIPFVDQLGPEGSLVVWERMDRAVEQDGTEAGRKHFVRRVNDACQHLELVFHRYLANEKGIRRIKILVNGRALKPFDPFHVSHPATIPGQVEKVQVGMHVVEIQPYTLPHHRNVTPAEWDHYAGPAGYQKNQGFYLYREKRLILYGTWFGLARQMELTKLTRVRIDMPNGLDSEWQVDVKKASARPPLQVRQRLIGILEEIGAPSRRIYKRRGAKLHDSRLPIWQRVQENNEIVYRLNQENPVLQAFGKRLPADLASDYLQLLQAAGAGLPMDAIFADLAGEPENVKSERLSEETLVNLLRISADGLISHGIKPEQIPEMLRVVEPFRSNWDRTEVILHEHLGAGN